MDSLLQRISYWLSSVAGMSKTYKILLGVCIFVFLILLLPKPNTKPPEPKKKVELDYIVLQDVEFLDKKRSVDVLLPKKVSEETLLQLAYEIRTAKKHKKFEKTFICYYLPGMEPGKGAWAISHFNPSLNIRILKHVK